MKKLYLSVVLCLLCCTAFATRYFPASVSVPSGGATAYCVGQMNESYSVTVSMCGLTTGGGAATNTIAARWFWNGTLVYLDPVTYTPSDFSDHVFTLPAGEFTLSPAGTYSASGTGAGSGLVVRLNWTNAAPAGCTLPGNGPMFSAPLTIVVNTPTANTGTASVCVGGTTTLANSAAGGTWSSGDPAIATVAADGVVTGVTDGTATISYSAGGCTMTTVVTVNPLPAAITGTAVVCTGNTTTLSTTSTGGTWSSSNASIALADVSGGIEGVTPGTALISYTVPTGCYTTTVITVNASPAAISGGLSVCTGATTTLSNATGGGTWTSSAPAVATISPSGVVSGIAAGTTTISYNTGSCGVMAVVTVYAPPAAITGPGAVCEGRSITLSSATTGGTWVSTNTGVATADAATGAITGMAAGATIISYVLHGCAVSTTIVVNQNPAPIGPGGIAAVCEGRTMTLTDATAGGTWSSSAATIATIDGGGVVSGIAAGTSTITYTITATGCYAVREVIVNANPPAIGGTPSVCVGGTTTLTNAVAGGTWSSSAPAIAPVMAGGVTGGLAAGTAVITYTLGTGCSSSTTVTVNVPAGPISGLANVCAGSTIELTDTVAGGVWSSSNIATATVSATGIVEGVAAGVAQISYTMPGCGSVLHTVNVFPQPAAITGTAVACVGTTTSLFNATAGGTWASGSTGIASVGETSGIVTGVNMGTASVSYILPGGCQRTIAVTVHPMAALTGDDSVCAGGTTHLTSIVGGGAWSSSNVAIATADAATGAVTGIVPGISYLVYTLPTGCIDSVLVRVLPAPAAISGSLNVCRGGSVVLAHPGTGGVWSGSNPFVATVNPTTGAVTGIYPDTVRVTYTMPHECVATALVTVNATPAPTVAFNATAKTLSVVSPTFLTYQWYDSTNGILTGATAPTLTLPAYSAYFYVVVMDANGCTGTAGYRYEHPAGIAGQLPEGLEIYPNPATTTVHIKADRPVNAMITTVEGKIMLRGRGNSVDLTPLAAGMYLLTVLDEEGNRIAIRKVEKL